MRLLWEQESPQVSATWFCGTRLPTIFHVASFPPVLTAINAFIVFAAHRCSAAGVSLDRRSPKAAAGSAKPGTKDSDEL